MSADSRQTPVGGDLEKESATDIRGGLKTDRLRLGLVNLLGYKRHRYLFVVNGGLCGGYADSGPVELVA
jgi:hypothetical protein